MPIYEFRCLTCGNEFEKLQSFSDTLTPACPNCQSVNVQRQLSPPAIHFKGSGWYITDSKNGAKNGAKNGSVDKEPAAKIDEAKSTSTESEGKATPATSDGESKVAAKSDTAAKSEKSSAESKSKAE